MTWKERERAFYIGAPLAIVPALGFLPAVTFLVVVPKVVHARLIALVLLPVLGLASSFGLWKLAISAVQRPFGILNALSFGAAAGPADHRELHGSVPSAHHGQDLGELQRCPSQCGIPARNNPALRPLSY